jgi:hypothetical protein
MGRPLKRLQSSLAARGLSVKGGDSISRTDDRAPTVMTAAKLGVGDRRALWVVLADTPGQTIETARATGCDVDEVVETLSEETAECLRIQPLEPMLL